MDHLEDYERVAVVTGAAQGLGLAITKKLLENGKKVVFIDVNQALLHELEQSYRFEYKERAMFIQTDVSNIVQIRETINTIINKWARIDILVNNAGIREETSIENIEEQEWDRIIDVNLKGTFFFSQSVIDVMKKQKWGRIINMSSFGGQVGPLTSGAHYCASKAGQLALTKVFARSLSKDGITVNAVAPAAIRTPEMDRIEPGKLAKMVEGIPVGRVGEDLEVAELVLYLASGSAGYITGSTFDINGGLLMR
ncbi:MAG TPA: SDR family oxidoreductase [Bacillales bacterium]|nr:SDR family oxidoreductase [Bacillales bacterium]